MMSALLDIIMENVLELTALHLSDNKLYVVDSLRVLVTKFPNFKSPSHWKKPDELLYSQ
jgi:hypothetical protein